MDKVGGWAGKRAELARFAGELLGGEERVVSAALVVVQEKGTTWFAPIASSEMALAELGACMERYRGQLGLPEMRGCIAAEDATYEGRA